MSIETNPHPDDDTELLAGEYVLGTLPADEMAAVESRLAAEASLAAAVTDWMRRLFALTQLPSPVTPQAGLWPRIERSLDQAQSSRATPRPVPRTANTRWSWLALAASVVLLALSLTLLRGHAPPQPLAVTVLNTPDGKPGWIVQAYADGTVGIHPLAGVNTEVAAGSTLQFWTKRNNVEGPVSLGLMTPAGAEHVSLGKLPLPVDGQIFELTLEPAGGSTVGHPTGPVLFKGLSATLAKSSS